MVSAAVWASVFRGASLLGLLGAGATLSVVQFMAGAGAAGGSAVLAGTVLAVGVMLLLLGALIAGGVVGLRHRGDWREALPAGMLTGGLGYLLQLVVVVGLLSALAALMAIGPGGAGWALPRITALQVVTIFVLAIPVGFVSTAASLVASSIFRAGEETPVFTTARSVLVNDDEDEEADHGREGDEDPHAEEDGNHRERDAPARLPQPEAQRGPAAMAARGPHPAAAAAHAVHNGAPMPGAEDDAGSIQEMTGPEAGDLEPVPDGAEEPGNWEPLEPTAVAPPPATAATGARRPASAAAPPRAAAPPAAPRLPPGHAAHPARAGASSAAGTGPPPRAAARPAAKPAEAAPPAAPAPGAPQARKPPWAP